MTPPPGHQLQPVVRRRKRHTEVIVQEPHVRVVRLGRLVAKVSTQLRGRRAAADLAATDDPGHRRVVVKPADTVQLHLIPAAVGRGLHGVQVDLTSIGMPESDRRRQPVPCHHEPSVLQQRPGRRHALGGDNKVQIRVASGLAPHQRIDTPSAIDPRHHADPRQRGQDRQHLLGRHPTSLPQLPAARTLRARHHRPPANGRAVSASNPQPTSSCTPCVVQISTADFKIRVIGAELRRRGATTEQPATVALGISVDEIERARPGVDPQAPYQRRVYPLLDLGLRRSDCRRVIADAGLPVPRRSACWFCPFHSQEEWRSLKRETPELFERACWLEGHLNKQRRALGRDPVWLTRHGRPLAEVIDDQEPLPGLDGCDSGWCMT